MDLAKIWRAWIAASEETVADMRSRMCIALDAVACNEVDHVAAWFAETMPGIAGDCFHYASEFSHLAKSCSGCFGDRAPFLAEVS
jgi:hypothetical protein